MVENPGCEKRSPGDVLIGDSDHVVLVLGAGATRCEMGSPAPHRAPPLDGDFLQCAQAVSPGSFNQLSAAFSAYWGTAPPKPLKYHGMEELFAGAFLETRRWVGTTKRGKEATKVFDQMLACLRLTIQKTTSIAYPDKHYRFIHGLNPGAEGSLTVLSFNYDVLCDRALRWGGQNGDWSWDYRDGYGFRPDNASQPKQASGIHLLKPHGSLNWLVARKKTRQAAIPEKELPYIPAPPSNPKAISWGRNQRIRGHQPGAFVFPSLIPPVFEKSTFLAKHYREIWEAADSALQKATLVVVWGYSMPPADFHAVRLFQRAARVARPRLIVINPDPNALGRVGGVLGHQWQRWFFSFDHFAKWASL